MQFAPLIFLSLLLVGPGAADDPSSPAPTPSQATATPAGAAAATDATPASSSASAKPEPVAQWALTSATRHRDEANTTCDWALSIRDEAQGPADQAAELCRFRVTARDGEPCDRVQFANLPCSPESDWVMNGGFSTFQSFMVVIVYNVREQAKAYFGFEATALDRGDPIPKQIASAFSTRPQEGQRPPKKY